MTGTGLFPGDIAVVVRSRTAIDGSIVLALLEGEFTIKRYRNRAGKVWLQAEHLAFPDIELPEDCAFEVWGWSRRRSACCELCLRRSPSSTAIISTRVASACFSRLCAVARSRCYLTMTVALSRARTKPKRSASRSAILGISKKTGIAMPVSSSAARTTRSMAALAAVASVNCAVIRKLLRSLDTIDFPYPPPMTQRFPRNARRSVSPVIGARLCRLGRPRRAATGQPPSRARAVRQLPKTSSPNSVGSRRPGRCTIGRGNF
jgi:hypothetical protein